MRKRPTKEDLERAKNQKVRDVIGPDLKVLFCGINPSLYSGAVGYHFARPGNRFWPTLHAAGFTDRIYSPEEDLKLVEVGCGITNVVARATARADELSSDEFVVGAEELRKKLKKYQPQYLAVLGIGAFRSGFQKPKATWGLQPETIEGIPVWVLPNPSGLNAHFQLPDLARVFGELKSACR